MNHDEKLVYFATAPRAYAVKINHFIDGNFVSSYVGKLRGKIVSHPDTGEYKFATMEEAKCCAMAFRQMCKDKALSIGLNV